MVFISLGLPDSVFGVAESFAFQPAPGYAATGTAFRIVPWVLLCMVACNEAAIARCKRTAVINK